MNTAGILYTGFNASYGVMERGCAFLYRGRRQLRRVVAVRSRPLCTTPKEMLFTSRRDTSVLP